MGVTEMLTEVEEKEVRSNNCNAVRES
jgi:hypothetical protein